MDDQISNADGFLIVKKWEEEGTFIRAYTKVPGAEAVARITGLLGITTDGDLIVSGDKRGNSFLIFPASEVSRCHYTETKDLPERSAEEIQYLSESQGSSLLTLVLESGIEIRLFEYRERSADTVV